MAPEELFGVIVRTVGLMLMLWGGWYLWYGIGASVSSQEPEEDGTTPGTYLGFGSVVTGLGAILAFGADRVVDLLY